MANPPRLLEQVRNRIRARHMSLRTEKTYLQWIRRYVRLHRLKHPRELGRAQVEAFLTLLAVDGKVVGVHPEPGPCSVAVPVSARAGDRAAVARQPGPRRQGPEGPRHGAAEVAAATPSATAS